MNRLLMSMVSTAAATTFACTASAQCGSTLTSDDGAAADHFGSAVGMVWSQAVVGAPGDDRPGLTDAGAAYAYFRNGITWSQQQKLVAYDSTPGAEYGKSISIGAYMAIGAPHANTPAGTDRGAVYVYTYGSNGQWQFHTKLTAPDGGGGDQFGSSVSTFGSWVLVGSPQNSNARGAQAGAAYLYTFANGTWSMVRKFIPTDAAAGDRCGSSVAISGSTIAISSPFASSNGFTGNGAVNLYRYNPDAPGFSPTFDRKLTASDAYTGAGYGFRIAAYYDTVMISDPNATVNGMTAAGKFYLYTRANGTWTEQITAPPAVANRSYGQSVSIDSYHVAIGGVGATAVFHTQANVPTLDVVIDDPSHTSGDRFGSDVCTYGQRVIVGDSFESPANAAGEGNAHVFYLNAPGGDTCATAPSVDAGVAVTTGCTSLATPSGASTCGSTNSSKDVYFQFTPRCSGQYTLSTEGSAFDTVVSVHTACPATAADSIACNDDVVAGTHWSLLTVNLTADQTYYIRVGGYQLNEGAFVLDIDATFAAPINDTCAAATPIGNGNVTVSTCNATFNTGISTCNTGVADIWYRYTAPCTGVATIEICQHNFDPTLDVYPAACASTSQPPIACNDDGCGPSGARVQFHVTSGQSYLVRVGSWQAFTGSGIMSVSCNPCPCNWNHDAVLNSQDMFDFLSAFFQGNADYNLDGLTNSQDFFDFLACFFASC